MSFKQDYRVISAGTSATLYTVPTGAEASAPTLTLTAVGTATATLTIFDNASSAAIAVAVNIPLTANVPWALPKPLMLNDGDEIRVAVAGADVGSILGIFEDTPIGQAVIFNVRGPYVNAATYDKGDVAEEAGTSYICRTNGTTGDRPPSANWMINAEKGNTGDMDLATYDPQGIGSDAFARANHTGTQLLATISDAAAALALKSNLTTNTFTGKQTLNGSDSTFGLELLNAVEKTTVIATVPPTTVNFNVNDQSVIIYTTNATATWTVNLRFSSGTSLNNAMSVGQSVTVTLMASMGGTAYLGTSFEIDGSTITPLWQGGEPDDAGASGTDVYSFTATKTAASTYKVIASMTSFN